MAFYHDLITQKSWQVLLDLRKKYKFILIGGWAVFLYTKALKSKDIDLVVDYEELEKIRQEFTVFKNERLKKYEGRKEEAEIDIYVPFYSNLGIPVEEIKKFTVSVEGFTVAEKEVLAILKQNALKQRGGSLKGRKDLIDLVSLFSLSDFQWDKYFQLIREYRLKDYLDFFRKTLKSIFEIKELGLNTHQFNRVKKKILLSLETP